MECWRGTSLNTALPKGLGFVAPFYARRSPMWKHLSDDQPAFYNAVDADMALQCWLGIRRDLKKGDLYRYSIRMLCS
jgi:hypothetical protein